VTAIRETALGNVDDAGLAAKLPHVSPRARTALRLAIEQARAGDSPAVGTGHLLGGMLAEAGNLALHVLRAVDIEPERVGRDLAAQSLTEPGPAGADGQALHFSGSAANALELAVTEATAFGHNYVGCEHLLLGLIAEPDSVAGQVLRSLGAELQLTRRAVTAALAGYVHLKAQTSQGAAATGENSAAAVATAVRQELEPLLRRIQRLEERVGAAED
jgi:ATP-dependent Clp protease ATP-binding subunit ClpC